MTDLKLGIISEYDPKTMSARVVSSDGSGTEARASLLLKSLDYGSGTYDVTPPSPGSPCVYGRVGSEAIIFGYYLPINLGEDSVNTPPKGITLESLVDQNPDQETSTGIAYTRAPSDMSSKSTLSGDSVQKGPGGSEIGFYGNMYKVYINPMLYSIWNGLSNIWDMCCSTLHFKSPGLEVHSIVENNKDCNIEVLVRESASNLDNVPIINLQLGKNANVIRLAINGKSFCRVDRDRNVTLEGKILRGDFELVDLTTCGKVELP